MAFFSILAVLLLVAGSAWHHQSLINEREEALRLEQTPLEAMGPQSALSLGNFVTLPDYCSEEAATKAVHFVAFVGLLTAGWWSLNHLLAALMVLSLHYWLLKMAVAFYDAALHFPARFLALSKPLIVRGMELSLMMACYKEYAEKASSTGAGHASCARLSTIPFKDHRVSRTVIVVDKGGDEPVVVGHGALISTSEGVAFLSTCHVTERRGLYLMGFADGSRLVPLPTDEDSLLFSAKSVTHAGISLLRVPRNYAALLGVKLSCVGMANPRFAASMVFAAIDTGDVRPVESLGQISPIMAGFEHDSSVYSVRGASGAPIWQRGRTGWVIVGVNWGRRTRAEVEMPFRVDSASLMGVGSVPHAGLSTTPTSEEQGRMNFMNGTMDPSDATWRMRVRVRDREFDIFGRKRDWDMADDDDVDLFRQDDELRRDLEDDMFFEELQRKLDGDSATPQEGGLSINIKGLVAVGKNSVHGNMTFAGLRSAFEAFAGRVERLPAGVEGERIDGVYPLQEYGRARGVNSRHTLPKAPGPAAALLRSVLDEEVGYQFPPRGGLAEMASLRVQFKRMQRNHCQSYVEGLEDFIAEVLAGCGVTIAVNGSLLAFIRAGSDRLKAFVETGEDKDGVMSANKVRNQVKTYVAAEVRPVASPGWPFAVKYAQCRDISEETWGLIVEMVVRGVAALELESRGEAVEEADWLTTFVTRLLVKNEPHPMRKVEVERWRLIFSMSVVVALMQRLLFGPLNHAECESYQSGGTIPVMCGIGFSDTGAMTAAESLKRVKGGKPSDVGGYDMSVDGVEARIDAKRRALCLTTAGATAALEPLFKTFARKIMTRHVMTSDGRTFKFVNASDEHVQPSGQLNTASTNGWVRVMRRFIAWLCRIARGHGWSFGQPLAKYKEHFPSVQDCVESLLRIIRAMGDDAKEVMDAEVEEAYANFGSALKPGAAVRDLGVDGVEFCSQFWPEDSTRQPWPIDPRRSLVRMAYGQPPSEQEGSTRWLDYEDVLRHHPLRAEWLEKARRVLAPWPLWSFPKEHGGTGKSRRPATSPSVEADGSEPHSFCLGEDDVEFGPLEPPPSREVDVQRPDSPRPGMQLRIFYEPEAHPAREVVRDLTLGEREALARHWSFEISEQPFTTSDSLLCYAARLFGGCGSAPCGDDDLSCCPVLGPVDEDSLREWDESCRFSPCGPHGGAPEAGFPTPRVECPLPSGRWDHLAPFASSFTYDITYMVMGKLDVVSFSTSRSPSVDAVFRGLPAGAITGLKEGMTKHKMKAALGRERGNHNGQMLTSGGIDSTDHELQQWAMAQDNPRVGALAMAAQYLDPCEANQHRNPSNTTPTAMTTLTGAFTVSTDALGGAVFCLAPMLELFACGATGVLAPGPPIVGGPTLQWANPFNAALEPLSRSYSVNGFKVSAQFAGPTITDGGVICLYQNRDAVLIPTVAGATTQRINVLQALKATDRGHGFISMSSLPYEHVVRYTETDTGGFSDQSSMTVDMIDQHQNFGTVPTATNVGPRFAWFTGLPKIGVVVEGAAAAVPITIAWTMNVEYVPNNVLISSAVPSLFGAGAAHQAAMYASSLMTHEYMLGGPMARGGAHDTEGPTVEDFDEVDLGDLEKSTEVDVVKGKRTVAPDVHVAVMNLVSRHGVQKAASLMQQYCMISPGARVRLPPQSAKHQIVALEEAGFGGKSERELNAIYDTSRRAERRERAERRRRGGERREERKEDNGLGSAAASIGQAIQLAESIPKLVETIEPLLAMLA